MIDKRTCEQRLFGDEEKGDGGSVLGGKKKGGWEVKGSGPLKGGGSAVEVASEREEGRASQIEPPSITISLPLGGGWDSQPQK